MIELSLMSCVFKYPVLVYNSVKLLVVGRLRLQLGNSASNNPSNHRLDPIIDDDLFP